MFILQAEKNKLTMTQREQMTSGSVNVYRVRFEFSDDWTGLERVAVFRNVHGEPKFVILDDTNECIIPREVLTIPNVELRAGVYGTLSGDIVLPTVWTSLGTVMEGVEMPEDGQIPPTPELWRQELAKKQDKLTGAPGQMVGFDSNGNAVPVNAPSGGGGEGGGSAYGVGHGLKVVDGDLTVVTTDDFTGDNTLPMTAAGVQNTLGNIEALLATI